MVWANLLFLLIVTAAASSDDVDLDHTCYVQVADECLKDTNEPVNLPGTEEALEEFCKFFLTVSHCMYEGLGNCDNAEDDRAFMQDVVTNSHRICDEDSLIHTALIEHLPCLHDMEDPYLVCPYFPEDAFGSFTETLASIGISDVAAPDSERNKCLEYLYRFGCLAAHVGRSCSDVARDIIIDISQGFDSLFASCRPGVKENLVEIAKVMQAEEEKLEAVEKKRRRKK